MLIDRQAEEGMAEILALEIEPLSIGINRLYVMPCFAQRYDEAGAA